MGADGVIVAVFAITFIVVTAAVAWMFRPKRITSGGKAYGQRI